MSDVLQKMLNGDSLEDAKKGKIVYLDVDELKPNPLNTASIHEIDELAANINEGGLLQPLIVMRKNNSYVIHSGHRRYEAIKKIFAQGKTIDYVGKQFEYEIPCIVYGSLFKNDVDEQISLMRSNSYRHYTKEERIEVVTEAHKLYEQLSDEEKPSGREREWITNLTGISDGLVKNILASLNQEIAEEDSSGQIAPEEGEDVVDIKREAKKLIKSMNKLADQIEKKAFSKSDLDENTKQNFTDAVGILMEVLMKSSY